MATNDRVYSLVHMVLTVYPKVIRPVILRYVQQQVTAVDTSGSALDNFLYRNRAIVFQSTIGEDRQDVFFPRNEESDIEQWDVHMLVWFILNVCPDLDEDVRAAVQRLHNLSEDILNVLNDTNEQSRFVEIMKRDIQTCLKFIQDNNLTKTITKEIDEMGSSHPGQYLSNPDELHKWHNAAKKVKDRFKDTRGKLHDAFIGMYVTMMASQLL